MFGLGLDPLIRNTQGHSSVHKAAWRGQRDVCVWLRDGAGVAPSAFGVVDKNGYAPADIARLAGHGAVQEWLVAAAAAVEERMEAKDIPQEVKNSATRTGTRQQQQQQQCVTMERRAPPPSPPPTLSTLPTDVAVLLLSYLPPRDIARTTAVIPVPRAAWCRSLETLLHTVPRQRIVEALVGGESSAPLAQVYQAIALMLANGRDDAARDRGKSFSREFSSLGISRSFGQSDTQDQQRAALERIAEAERAERAEWAERADHGASTVNATNDAATATNADGNDEGNEGKESGGGACGADGADGAGGASTFGSIGRILDLEVQRARVQRAQRRSMSQQMSYYKSETFRRNPRHNR